MMKFGKFYISYIGHVKKKLPFFFVPKNEQPLGNASFHPDTSKGEA